MGTEWILVHRTTHRQNLPINIEIEYEPSAKRKYVYGPHPEQSLTYYIYENVKYARSIMQSKIKIKNLLKLGNKPKYYSNFVMFGNESFNGITKDIVKELIREVVEERKRKELRDLRAKLEMDGD